MANRLISSVYSNKLSHTTFYGKLNDKKRKKNKRHRKHRRPLPPINLKGFYDSQEWKELRFRVLVKYGATCMCCGNTRNNGVRIHVDHIKPVSLYPELRLTFSNLQVLCEICNQGKSNIDQTDWRK